MRWLMKHNITLALLNWNGNLLATTLPPTPKSGKLRVRQYQNYCNFEQRFKIASEIVNDKVLHTANLLKELSEYYKEIGIVDIDKIFERKKRMDTLQRRKSIDNLMNYEVRIATFYWEQLAKVFNKLYPNFHFKSRENKSYSWNNNAYDEVNALLNYGYAILEAEIRKCINAVGLDPAIGFLHETTESKTSLVFDLQ